MDRLAHTRYRRKAASAVSYVINPLVLPPILLVALLVHFEAPFEELTAVATTAFVLFTLLPLGFLIAYRYLGGSASLEVRDRSRRAVPYAFVFGCGVAALVALYVQIGTARPLLLAVLVIINVNTALLFLINTRIKISIHAAAAAGFVAMLLFVALVLPNEAMLDPAHLIWLVPAVPGVMWARVHSGAHSPAEVVLGALFGAVAPAAELSLLAWLGIIL